MNENKFEVNSFQIANAVIDDLLCELSGAELKCYLIIIRKTKGWQKEADAISISQFMEYTGLSRTQVINACKTLEQKELIENETGKRNVKIFRCKNYTITSTKSELVQKVN